MQVSAVEVLAPVFGTQKRGSNTGRVSSCIIPKSIPWQPLQTGDCLWMQPKIVDLPPGLLCLWCSKAEVDYCFCRLAVSAFQADGDWERLL